jgi:hypothetical protein
MRLSTSQTNGLGLATGATALAAACASDYPDAYAVNDVSRIQVCEDAFGHRVEDWRCPDGNAFGGYRPAYADVYDSYPQTIWYTDDRGRLQQRVVRDYSRGGTTVPAVGASLNSRQFSTTRPANYSPDTTVVGSNPRGGAISRSGTGTGAVTTGFRTVSGSRTITSPGAGLSSAKPAASSSSSSSGSSSVSRGGFGSTSSSSGNSAKSSSYSSSSSSSSSSSGG